MNFWQLMVKKDDAIVSLIEHIRKLVNYLSFKNFSIRRIMKQQENQFTQNEIYIILNAPSLKTQDLSVLQGKDIMFVNRGFNHSLYETLQPKFHAFIDNKMINGIWPVSWIDQILEKSPNTTILLPINWYTNELFKPYIKNKTNIYWIYWNLPFFNLGVSGACFSFAIKQNYKNIYFTGFDATGIGHEMIKSAESHFYGTDSELEGKTSAQFTIDLLMHSRQLHDLNRLAKYCKKKNISVYNLTNGGLLDMFPRKNILPTIN